MCLIRRLQKRAANSSRTCAVSPHISGVVSPWDGSAQSKGLISEDGKTALVIAQVSGGENNAPKYAKAVADQVTGERDGLTVLAGGTAMVATEINEQSEKDLLIAEAIALPLSLVVSHLGVRRSVRRTAAAHGRRDGDRSGRSECFEA